MWSDRTKIALGEKIFRKKIRRHVFVVYMLRTLALILGASLLRKLRTGHAMSRAIYG